MTALRPGSLAVGRPVPAVARRRRADQSRARRAHRAGPFDRSPPGSTSCSPPVWSLPAGEARSSGGRPPTRFAFDPHARVVLAADLGATHATLAVTDLGAEVIGESTEPIGSPTARRRCSIICGTTWRRCSNRRVARRTDVAGVGIGVPGPVEFATGRPTSPPIMPGWDGFDIPAFIPEHVDAPVLVDNDVNLMALGEFDEGWRGCRSSAVRQDRHRHRRRHRLRRSAEPRGAGIGRRSGPCAGGRRFDAPMHLRQHRLPGGGRGRSGHRRPAARRGLDVDSTADVVELVRSGDPVALQRVRQAGRDIGAVLATCVNLLNPSVIVIGGPLAEAGEHLLAGVREVVYHRSPPLATQHLRISPQPHRGPRRRPGRQRDGDPGGAGPRGHRRAAAATFQRARRQGWATVNGVIGDILPLALCVAISPIPIIAAILMLFSPRAAGTSSGFLIGWRAGRAAVAPRRAKLAGPESVSDRKSLRSRCSRSLPPRPLPSR